jgi:hypothetical protein
MREKASAAKKNHPSTPYPLRSRCSRPLPISVRPRLPSSSRWLSSFARRRPPSPAVIVALALVPGPSASALACRQRPLVVVALALVPCPSASALACRRRCAGSCPLPVGVRPRLPSLSRWLSSLARRRPPSPAVSAHSSSSRWLSSLARRRPPSPAVAVAPALVPGPSASALACRQRPLIRSNTMSHITLKMCQFVLIVHLRDYHNDVMVLLWCSSTYLYYISKFMSD